MTPNSWVTGATTNSTSLLAPLCREPKQISGLVPKLKSQVCSFSYRQHRTIFIEIHTVGSEKHIYDATKCVTVFTVIRGHQLLYQLKVYMQLPVRDQ